MAFFALAVYIAGTAFADGGMTFGGTYIVGVVPAAFAFFAAAHFGRYRQFFAFVNGGFGYQQRKAQFVAEHFQIARQIFGGGDVDFGLQR